MLFDVIGALIKLVNVITMMMNHVISSRLTVSSHHWWQTQRKWIGNYKHKHNAIRYTQLITSSKHNASTSFVRH